jgi:RNA polymerase sigma factor (TIGR02999 family)
MGLPPSKQITQLLVLWREGEQEALDQLIPLVYAELHRMAERYMRRERPNHTLQASALIHEAYLRLVDQREAPWQSRGQFFALSAKLMRRILVDRARSKGCAKRGAKARQVTLDEGAATSGKRAGDVLALDDALKDLEAFDRRKSQIVEMRFFAGFSLEETAEALEISVPTIEREWRAAKAWLHKAITMTQTRRLD